MSTGHKRTSGSGRLLTGVGSGQAKTLKESPPNKKARNSKHGESSVNAEISSSSSPVKPETLIDIFCDPENPKKVQFQDVSAAAYKIKTGIFHTPCSKSRLSDQLGMDIYFKKEFLQFTGSFKERGARYALLSLTPEQKKVGVIAASAGNHALALCYHGVDLGIPVTVVMPKIAPLMKVQNCRTYGAEVIIHGKSIFESREFAMKMGKENGKMYINGYDHPHIIAGQGTMGLEILEQVPDLDACIIPVGGGGLLAGTALAIKNLKPDVQVIGVESENCPSFSASLKAGKAVYTESLSTLADGLAVPVVGVNALETAKDFTDKMVVVKEESIALAILRLIEVEKSVIEGAGAVGLAAVIEGLLPELKNKKVVIALCGGNIDTTILGRAIERGLAVDGRLVRFVVTVSDRPGGIAELAKLLSHNGASIKDMFHERAWLKSDVFSVQVKVVAETRDQEHADEIHTVLKANYKQVAWGPRYF
ncbi:L-threonine ammonia-lyase-like [Mytilus californianus]|uniref:L-threonine ammonia-lyase-like n=1 Tax=Mytilus californianus TaxID=6549 RepID=UPI002247BD4E|nr:L-threonine ammonia-lyase-like [Mytilus californianus]